MTRSLVTVVLFIALLALVPFALRRLQARRTGGIPGAVGAGARLVSTLAVGPQQKVVTVEVGPPGARTSLVLGVTAQSINCLHVLPVPRFEMAVDGGSDV